MKIVVASTNPAKINAAKLAFGKIFPHMMCTYIGVDVPSGVRAQPMSRKETESGSINRIRNASIQCPDAQYYVAMEGGLEEDGEFLRSVVSISIRTDKGTISTGYCGSFVLPPKVAQLVREGKELGEADDIVFGLIDSKKNQGAVGILTDGKLTRTEYYAQGIILTLIPFIHPELYP